MLSFPLIEKMMLLSDLHFGVSSHSQEWLSIQVEYFEEVILPVVFATDPETTAILIAGDIFDHRQAIGVMVLDRIIQIFQKLSERHTVFIILGNHDIYRRNATDITSVRILDTLPNVHVFYEPEMITIGSARTFMLPWRESHAAETEAIRANPADLLVLHTDIRGLSFNGRTKIEDGLEPDLFAAYRRVFSGHIHHRQQTKNVTMLGCPYPMTRNDLNNTKGYWWYTIDSDELEFVENTLSPRFYQMSLEWILDRSPSQCADLLGNQFVDVLVPPSLVVNHHFPVNKLSDLLGFTRRLELVSAETSGSAADTIGSMDGGKLLTQANLMEFVSEILKDRSYPDGFKKNIYENIKRYYNIARNAEGAA